MARLLYGLFLSIFLCNWFVPSSLALGKIQVQAQDGLVGSAQEINVEGLKAYQAFELRILTPDHRELVFNEVSQDDGSEAIFVQGAHLGASGTYYLGVSTLDNAYYGSGSFKLIGGTVSKEKSVVEIDNSFVALGEYAFISVQLKDQFSNPVAGHKVSLLSSSPLLIEKNSHTTDAEGKIQFRLSQGTGAIEIKVRDESSQTQVETLQVFFGNNTDLANTGGWIQEDDLIRLASSGPIASFEITGLPTTVQSAATQSVNVRAIDANGETVSDYTGTIRFSSSDSQATLPNDYSFKAEDQGSHNFSLGVKLLSPGLQTITVTDINQFTISGDAGTTVSTSGNNSNDFDSDFVDNDFEREGDFVLISPASGSYSSNTINVEGEADYGNTAVLYINDEEAGRTEVEFENTFSYTVQNLSDGSYELYVDIVKEEGGEETLVEQSEVEQIKIDTTAPELIDIKSESGNELEPNTETTLTVLSERNLNQANILFENELYELQETSTAGKYQVKLVSPSESGEYTVDVILMDALGNEVQYRDQLTLKVSANAEEAPSEEPIEAVSGLTAFPLEEAVMLSWESPEGGSAISYYRVYYGPSPESLFASSSTQDASTSYSIQNLMGNQAYYFAVSSIDKNGEESTLSAVVSATPSAKAVSPSPDDEVPGRQEPAINGLETPSQTPETGPELWILLSVSFALAGFFVQKQAKA